jgi:hypothetical protein
VQILGLFSGESCDGSKPLVQAGRWRCKGLACHPYAERLFVALLLQCYHMIRCVWEWKRLHQCPLPSLPSLPAVARLRVIKCTAKAH